MDSELHGYELRRAVEERMSHVAKIAPGTIYYTLKKLEKNGWVTHRAEREGNRPERQVYEITDEGRERFREMLAVAVRSDERPYYQFDVALYFYPHVDRDALLDAVREKLEHVDQFTRQLEQLANAYPGKWPFHLEALRTKGRLLSSAMEDWYRFLEDGLEKRLGKRGPRGGQKKSARKKTSRTSGGARRKEAQT
jgi:DNA-binding PadR family transcriptional regulator